MAWSTRPPVECFRPFPKRLPDPAASRTGGGTGPTALPRFLARYKILHAVGRRAPGRPANRDAPEGAPCRAGGKFVRWPLYKGAEDLSCKTEATSERGREYRNPGRRVEADGSCNAIAGEMSRPGRKAPRVRPKADKPSRLVLPSMRLGRADRGGRNKLTHEMWAVREQISATLKNDAITTPSGCKKAGRGLFLGPSVAPPAWGVPANLGRRPGVPEEKGRRWSGRNPAAGRGEPSRRGPGRWPDHLACRALASASRALMRATI